jgi:multiple sugar transport system ATP-binding protein
VKTNMSFGLKMRRMKKSEIEARVKRAAEVLELSDLLGRKPKELSGGQRQRVAMGRAIVRDPKVFLFDEPLSNLDAKLRVQMRAEIAKMHQRIGTTIIYVTHDQVEAMTLADRIVVMDGGLVQQVGTPLDLFEHPKNRFVAGFIGSPAMNFVACALEAGALLRGEGFKISIPETHRRAVEGRSGEMELGLRPENLKVEAPRDDILQATVDVREPMGAETFLYASHPGGLLTIRDAAHSTVKVGDRVGVVFEMERAHLFDSRTKEAIF